MISGSTLTSDLQYSPCSGGVVFPMSLGIRPGNFNLALDISFLILHSTVHAIKQRRGEVRRGRTDAFVFQGSFGGAGQSRL